MPIQAEKANLYPMHECSFCGKDDRDVSVLIAGDGAYICDECVVVCVEIIFKNNRRLHSEHDVNGESHAN